MAQTRGATGNSKPRVFETVSTETTRKPRKTPATKKEKAVTKKPAAAGVTKKRATKTKPSLKDKAEGVVDKVAGAVEGKPGKKAAGEKKIRGGKTAKAI
ncbi:hypothetical protein H2200_008344 [Cladophialophora chaetospira]|uniref:Uncharacterized protein n=1 Tax=Cladophialophora chaetospira TaxID=386627 RepID=A0AA39CGH8_9EURO|nr:hypothetical protein H2200_008344 [Cladophialophora chaetospira]